jgi:hypothetical protein
MMTLQSASDDNTVCTFYQPVQESDHH